MRIAQIAPLYEAVPPPLYGGTERVIAGLCDGLVGCRPRRHPFAAEPRPLAPRARAHGPRRCASG